MAQASPGSKILEILKKMKVWLSEAQREVLASSVGQAEATAQAEATELAEVMAEYVQQKEEKEAADKQFFPTMFADLEELNKMHEAREVGAPG